MVDETKANDMPEGKVAAPSGGSEAASSAVDLMKQLSQRFAVFRECRPLAIGIHRSLLQTWPEINAATLRATLRRHTASTRYLKAVATGSVRFGLDGQAAGEVTDEQKQQASEALRERFRKGAERKREEEKVKIEREREAAREREHEAKLQALAAKFSRH
jgi:ProP effector